MSKPKHILVIRLSAMGDVAMTVPILRAIVAQHPDVKLTVLTKPFFKPLFRNIPNLTVFEADINGNHKGIVGLWKLSKSLNKTNFEVVADLHNVLRSKVLNFFFFGKKIVQIDKGRQEKKALIKGHTFNQLKTTHERYAEVFEKLGYKLDLTNPTFPMPKDLQPKHLEILGKDSKKWIGIAPFATHEGKMYALDLIAKVIKNLSQEHKVILFGAANEEAQLLDQLESQFDNVINLAGKLSLNEELDIISNLDAMLSMDSGNAHLAAMLGIKVITVWGVTHPYAGFLPFNQPIESAILADRTKFPKIPTSVYGNKLPQGYEQAINSISPEHICSKLIDVLNQKSPIPEE